MFRLRFVLRCAAIWASSRARIPCCWVQTRQNATELQALQSLKSAMAPFKRIASGRTLRPVSAKDDYRVGPGRPPREHQFKPGTSGNPEGARQRQPSIAPDLKALLQAALGKKTTFRLGDRERILTKAAAG